MQLFRMSATALLEAYKSGAVSPVEAMRSVLDRVARFEPHISATYLLSPERALAEAKGSEERWRRGQQQGFPALYAAQSPDDKDSFPC